MGSPGSTGVAAFLVGRGEGGSLHGMGGGREMGRRKKKRDELV